MHCGSVHGGCVRQAARDWGQRASDREDAHTIITICVYDENKMFWEAATRRTLQLVKALSI